MVDEVSEGLLSVADARRRGRELLRGPVLWFPIRHHSPACALQLRALIRERRPSTILIEGPDSMSELVPLLTNTATKAPIAVFTWCHLREPADAPTARHGAWYPLCDFSPELVAVREGSALGAHVEFIDMSFPEQVLANRAGGLSSELASFFGEQRLARSSGLARLARRLGCRDVDESWDALFEVWRDGVDSEEFVARVVAWCAVARAEVRDDDHERDGTAAREATMAARVRRRLDDREGTQERAVPGPVLVVTGGYHTVVLPDLVARGTEAPKIDTSRVTEKGSVMVRYSFDRVDRVSGYAAGIASPAHRQRVWERATAGDAGCSSLALESISAVAAVLRDGGARDFTSTPALISACEMAERLATLRGHLTPSRFDIVDAVVGSFIAGEDGPEGAPVHRALHEVLTGSRIGEVPPEAGLPPIVADFRSTALGFGLDLGSTARRRTTLDVYREEEHRKKSRFLHAVAFLDVPFGVRLAGQPLMVRGAKARLMETWEYGWAPQTDVALFGVAIHGNTVREAVTDRFIRGLSSWDADAGRRSAELAAEHLTRACQLGLHDLAALVVSHVSRCAHEDPSLRSVVGAMAQLLVLWESRVPLGAEGLDALPALTRTCFARACALLAEPTASDAADAAAAAVVELRAAASGSLATWFDGELLWSVLRRCASVYDTPPRLGGAACGALFGAGLMDESVLSVKLRGHLGGGGSASAAVAFLGGMALTAREVLWQSDEILATLRQIVESADDDAFLRLLPELRLAFASLTPQESDDVGRRVAVGLGLRTNSAPILHGMTASEMQGNLEASLALRDVLFRDGLGEWWSEPGREAAP